MSGLTDYLGSRMPTTIHMPLGTPLAGQSIEWALQLIAAHPQHSTLQIMKWARDGTPADAERPRPASNIRKGQREAIYYLDAKDPGTLQTFMRNVRVGKAVHGRLELFNFVSQKTRYRPTVEWAFRIFTDNFFAELQRRHPLGFHAASTLWLSAGRHVYGAHSDIQDAFLLHLAGTKRISIWPTPAEYEEAAVFSLSDLEGRMASEPCIFDLDPGEIAFIPAGAVHEVMAGDQQPVCSVSFHMGSPYPLLILCRELNRLAGRELVSVPAGMDAREMGHAYYFEPSRYARRDQPEFDVLPARLADILVSALDTGEAREAGIRELLAQWWAESARNLAYQCPFPDAWMDQRRSG